MEPERSVNKGGIPKKYWADPVWREQNLRKRQANIDRRKLVEDPILTSHKGIPWGYNRVQAMWFRRQAALEATLTMKKLEKAGIINPDDEYANEALHTALKVMRGPDNQPLRLNAAKLVLEYTKAKPVQRQAITVATAEDWLEAVTQDAQGTDSGPQALT
jgi:hypothetical protein